MGLQRSEVQILSPRPSPSYGGGTPRRGSRVTAATSDEVIAVDEPVPTDDVERETLGRCVGRESESGRVVREFEHTAGKLVSFARCAALVVG